MDLRIHFHRSYPDAVALIEPLEAAREATGYFTPSEFRRRNWGTPTNARDGSAVRLDNDHVVVQFRTAENSPELAVATLSHRYPRLLFTLYYGTAGDDTYFEDSWEDGSLLLRLKALDVRRVFGSAGLGRPVDHAG